MSRRKGQATLEACVLSILFVAAFLAIYGYFKSSIMGNWRTNIDSFSDEQYRPREDVAAGIDLNPTRETVSGLRFISPKIKADVGINDNIDETFNVSTALGITGIGGWGTYSE